MVSTLTLRSPRIWEHAVDTFGTPERAELWMATRLAELENRTPEEVLLQDPESRCAMLYLPFTRPRNVSTTRFWLGVPSEPVSTLGGL